jgi:hypothetical protein
MLLMKLWLLPLLLASLSLTSCVVDDDVRTVRVEHDDDGDYDDGDDDDDDGVRRVTTRRYISYSDTDPYYRVYYRDGGRTYYRQHYYDDVPGYSTRVDTRRYYYRTPATHTSVQYGY